MSQQTVVLDYDENPRFPVQSSVWTVDREKVELFTAQYARMVKSGDLPESDLPALAAGIFEDMAAQASSPEERAFLHELGKDVVQMTGTHVRYYTEELRSSRALKRDKMQLDLFENGHYITTISPETVNKIRSAAREIEAVVKERAAAGKLERDDLSINSGRAVRKIVRLLNSDFRKNGVLRSLDAIAPSGMKVVGVAYELSVAGSTWWRDAQAVDRPAKTLYAHVDREVDAPKAIVYLTDVRPENGPTTCYPHAYENVEKSAIQDLVGRCLETVGRRPDSSLREYYAIKGRPLDSERFKSHFMKLPPEVRFNSHFGWDVIPDSPQEDFLLSREKQVLGPAGTTLVFDGARLLHRGGQIEDDHRIVLQVIFGKLSIYEKASRIIRYVVRKLRGA